VEGRCKRRLQAAHLIGPAGTCTDVPTGPLTELSHCRFLGGHRHTRAIGSQKNAKLVHLRGATAVGYLVDRATASAASDATAMRRRATSQRRFCRREGGLSLRRSLHWPALVEIKDGRRAAATPRRVLLMQNADTRAKLSPPGPSSSALGARHTIHLPSPTSTAAADAFASAVLWSLFMESGKTCRRLSTNQRHVTMVTWVWGLKTSPRFGICLFWVILRLKIRAAPNKTRPPYGWFDGRKSGRHLNNPHRTPPHGLRVPKKSQIVLLSYNGPRIHELNRARGRTSLVVLSRSKSRIPRN